MSSSDRVVNKTSWGGGSLALLAFAQLIIATDMTIVYVALPEIGRELNFSVHTLQWVVSAYAVTTGGFLLLGGRCADLLGRRRMFQVGLLLYAVSSLVGGLARDPALLIAARSVQGLGGAVLFPATLSLINTMFAEGRQRNRALATWSAAGAAGLCLGSLLGGVLTRAYGWEAVFFVNVPLAGGAALLAPLVLPRDRLREYTRTFDLPGAFTVTAGVTLLVYALVQGPSSGWGSPTIVLSVVSASFLLVAFAAVEVRSPDPLMPPALLANRSLRSAMLITLIFGVTYMTVPYFLTEYFQVVRGYSFMQTGFAFLLPTLLIAAGTLAGERMATRIGVRPTLLIGNAIGLLGTALLAASLSADASYARVTPALLFWGAGQGIAWTAMWIAAAAGVSAGEQGVASGMASTAMQMGTAVGLAVLVAVANSGPRGLTGQALQERINEGLGRAVIVAATCIVLGIVVALTMQRSIPRAAPVQRTVGAAGVKS